MSGMQNREMAVLLAQKVCALGGRAYYVGGYVRDRLLGKENKDVDVEVHGLYPEQLEKILDQLGTRLKMGTSFGVYGLKGYDLDVAMPRKETALGRGHRDFQIDVDPFIGTRKAAIRRDFTINALMQDVLTGEIVDHFGGQQDLKQGILRHVHDDSFAEDALRVLRGAQFAARFSFTLAPETEQICKGIDLSVLSKERVMDEMRKALLKAEKPSVFFEVLRRLKQLSYWFPELLALCGVGQNPRFHGEGDVWNHTMLVLNQAALKREKVRQPLYFMLAALCHDLGKALCTREVEGVFHAYRHEEEGIVPAQTFLCRVTNEKELLSYVTNMIKLHMIPNLLFLNHSSVKATNKLFDQAKNPADLIWLSLCDDAGRIASYSLEGAQAFLFERLSLYEEWMRRPYVTGKDLLQAGLTGGKNFSEILSYAHKLRLAGIEKESALKQTLSYARKNKWL